MKGFRSGIHAEIKGYIAKDVEMQFTPNGKAVVTIRVGCGGSEKMPATFANIKVWGDSAERVNKLDPKKGMAVRAVGSIQLRTWKSQKTPGKTGFSLEAVYLEELEIQQGNELVKVSLDRKEKDHDGA